MKSGAESAADFLKSAIVVVPGLHILVSFIYLYFYHRSFGSRLQIFSSPTDVFAVSLKDIAPLYVGLIIGVFTGLASSKIMPSPPAAEPPSKAKKRLRAFTNPINAMILGSIFGLTGFVVELAATGFLRYDLLILASLGLVPAYYHLQRSKNRIDHVFGLYCYMGVVVLSMTSLSGLQNGQRDRIIRYEEARALSPTCGNYVILQAVGDRFLAAAPDQARVLLSSDCERKFVLLAPSAFRPKPRLFTTQD